MKLLAGQRSELPLEYEERQPDLFKKFYNSFCYYEPGEFTSKTELRKYFRKFLEKEVGTSKIRDIAICTYLTQIGYSGRKKKRLTKTSNPVGVMTDLRFDKEHFDNYINDGFKIHENTPAFVTIMETLKASIIPFDSSTLL